MDPYLAAMLQYVGEVAGREVLNLAVKQAQASKAWGFRERWNRIDRGECKTLVIGPGGTGKTQLGRLLKRECTWGRCSLRYRPSGLPEYETLPEGIKRKIVVLPGQFRGPTWEEHILEASAARRTLIVFVGAYGYHAMMEGKTWQDYARENGLKAQNLDDFRVEFLEKNRELEIKIFEELLAAWPKKSRAQVHVVLAYSKMDLWWDERKKVHTWYFEKFIPKIHDLAATLDKRSLTYQPWPLCLMKSSASDYNRVELFRTADEVDFDVAADAYDLFDGYLNGVMAYWKLK